MPDAAAISPQAPRGLRVVWRASIGSAINAQPLVVDRVRLRGRLATVVLIATEHGAMAGLDGRTGKTLWRRRLGRRKIGPGSGGMEALNVNRAGGVRSWRTTAGRAVFGGGIWGWGGVSIDNRTGAVYAATGNSYGIAGEAVPYAESVVQLSAGLVLRRWNDPLL